MAVYRETRRAVDRARAGEGPTLLELVTFRMGGHSSADDPTRYRDKTTVETWEKRCPLRRLRTWMESGVPGERSSIELDAETRRHLEALGYAR